MTMKQPVRPTPALRGWAWRSGPLGGGGGWGVEGGAQTGAGRGTGTGVPAVHHDGAGVGRVAGLDSPQKSQEWRWVLRHPVVRPRRELELADLTFLTGAILGAQDTACHHSPTTHMQRTPKFTPPALSVCMTRVSSCPLHTERSPHENFTSSSQHRQPCARLSPQTHSPISADGGAIVPGALLRT